GGAGPDGQRGAAGRQAAGHRQAHVAQADEADVHWAESGVTRDSPRPAAVFRCDWLSRLVLSGPPTVKYRCPATSSSSAGNLVMTSQPSAVTTSSSSIRAADHPSLAGQYVSSANTIPSSSTSGCSSDTSRLKIGFSQIDSPTPCPYCNANAAISSAKPNSSARGHRATMSAVVAPGLTSAIAASMYSRART